LKIDVELRFVLLVFPVGVLLIFGQLPMPVPLLVGFFVVMPSDPLVFSMLGVFDLMLLSIRQTGLLLGLIGFPAFIDAFFVGTLFLGHSGLCDTAGEIGGGYG
jgi:hypothetical protein